MARRARIVIPGLPHHVSQKSIEGQVLFNDKQDAETYLDILATISKNCGVDIWAYCLIQNEVHFIAMPKTEEALAKTVGEAHRQFSKYHSDKYDKGGNLWYDRFQSYVVDDAFLRSAIKYVEGLPVRLGVCDTAEKFIWSSAKAHLGKAEPHDVLYGDMIVRNVIQDWSKLLSTVKENGSNDNGRSAKLKSEVEIVSAHLSTGRPLGSSDFIDTVEMTLGYSVRPKKRGRKPKTKN
jgi:putative transposase